MRKLKSDRSIFLRIIPDKLYDFLWMERRKTQELISTFRHMDSTKSRTCRQWSPIIIRIGHALTLSCSKLRCIEVLLTDSSLNNADWLTKYGPETGPSSFWQKEKNCYYNIILLSWEIDGLISSYEKVNSVICYIMFFPSVRFFKTNLFSSVLVLLC